VAGTNGKGSVSSLIAATLQSQGYKTALYTSPHLVDFRERMRVNGEMIPRDRVVDFVERWKNSGYTGDQPSFFELTMMMAFEWFADMDVDYAVIEVGMGGRLDSTNIITPLLSVITNISKDHTQFLGETLAQIAYEKAGIIKPGIPAVIGEADSETENTFRSKAAAVGAPLREAYREIDNEANFSLECGLHGDYQQKNVNTARVAIDELRRHGVLIDDESIRIGFHDVESLTGLKGRWTVLSDNPLVICDTGHNEAGLKYNLRQLAKLRSERSGAKFRFVIGFVADKDVPHILPMFPEDALYYVSQAQIPRAMKWKELLEHCRSLGLEAKGYPCVRAAFEAAKKEASPQDIIYIGGSTFIVADFFSTDKKEI